MVLMEGDSFYSNEYINDFERSLLQVDRIAIKKFLVSPRDGASPLQRVEGLVIPALERIGQKWTTGEVSLSQVYMSGRICEEMVDLVLPPADPVRRNFPPMAIAVLEDYHILGKRIVYSCLRASGYELFNYPRMSVSELVHRVVQDKIEILLISVLMLPSALRVKDLRAGLEQVGWSVKIGVGGAPFRFDEDLWREVGADAVGHSASDAVAMIQSFLGDRK